MPSHPTLRFPTLHSASFSTASNSINANHSSNSTSSSSSTIASGPYAMSSRIERVVLSGKSSHPMMQMTLPVDDDEPLEPVVLSSNSSSDEDVAASELQEANVNVPKRRVFSAPSLNRSFSRGASKSAEKIQMPSLTRSFSKGAEKIPSFSKGAEKPPSFNKSFVKGAEKIPSFGRSSSATASATASRIVSKMAPMLRRVVSGAPSSNDSDTSNSSSIINNNTQDAPAKSPRLGHNFLDSDDEDRDSLLFMMQVPMVRRKSHIPLMSLSHSEE